MKFLYFGLIILVCFFSTGVCKGSNDERSHVIRKRGLLGKIGQVIGNLPGIKSLEHDLWDLIQSFDICELRCTGRFCHCCQKNNLVFVHLTVCINADLKPIEKQIEVSFSAMNKKLLGHRFSYEKFQSTCQTVSFLNIDSDVCVHWEVKEHNENGITICGHLDVKLKGIKAVEINLDCVCYDADIVLNGRTDIDGRTLAFIRVLNPIKFVELVKRIFLN